jgi:hypothetical protein
METMAATRAHVTWDLDRTAPIAGIVAVACWVLGVILIMGVTDEDKGPEILAQYQAHDGRILGGGIIYLIGVALFVWFLGGLRSRLLAAEGPDGRLTAIAFGGGVASAICLALIPGPDLAGALSKDDIDASGAAAIHYLTGMFFLAAEYLCPVLLAATAFVARRTGAVLPGWLAWITLLIAFVLLVAPIGWAALIFAFPIWVLVVSYVLWSGSAAGEAPGRPTSGAPPG